MCPALGFLAPIVRITVFWGGLKEELKFEKVRVRVCCESSRYVKFKVYGGVPKIRV